jgi:hypothetical protein
VQRPRRHAQRGIERVVAEDLAENPQEGCGLGAVDRLVERRDCQRLPQEGHEPRGLSVSLEPLRDGFPGQGGRRGASRHHATRRLERAEHPRGGVAVAPAEGLPAQQAAGEVQRRPPRGALEPRDHAVGVDAGERELLLELHAIGGAHSRQEPARFVVAAQQHVLPVVDVLAGLAIEERRGATAQLPASLEHQHTSAAVGERARGGEAGTAGPDHDCVGRGHLAVRNAPDACGNAMVRIHVATARRALWNFGTRTRSVKTSWSRAAMRASRSR